MPADYEKFRIYVDHFDLTEDGKREFVNQVWDFMENSFDRALQIDSTQIAMANGDRADAKRALDSGPVVELSSDEYRELDLNKVFSKQAGGKKGEE